MRQRLDAHRGRSRPRAASPGPVSLPHIAPRPGPPLASDTDMQCMHEIVYRNVPERVVDVPVHVAGAARCPASGTRRPAAAPRRCCRSTAAGPGLVVDGVEGGDQVEGRRLVPGSATSRDLEADVRQPAAVGLGAGARRSPPRRSRSRRSGCAGSCRPGRSAPGRCRSRRRARRCPRSSRSTRPGTSGRMCSVRRGDDGLAALLGHHLVEAGVGRVGHAAAVAERLDDLVLDRAQHGDPLRRATARLFGRGRPRQPGGVLRRQAIGLGLGVVLDDAAGRPSRRATRGRSARSGPRRPRSRRRSRGPASPARRTGRCGGRPRSSGPGPRG